MVDFFKEYMERTPTSAKLFAKERQYVPGGNSRHTYLFEPYPLYMKSAQGSKITDVDGTTRIDLANNFGPLILGHNPPSVLNSVRRFLETGDEFGGPTEMEIELAKMVCEAVPCAESVTFTVTGTEATLLAIRLARAFTGKPKIAKFEGHYHGTHDYSQISIVPPPDQAGKFTSPNAVPDSEGIPGSVTEDVVILPWNDLNACKNILEKNKDQVAGVILDPIAEASGIIPPDLNFIRGLREVTEKNGILLLFDEVVTGFRLRKGGAQELYGVTPDLAAFGKGLGGGYPVGAVAGRKDVLDLLEVKKGKPRVHQWGSFNAYPVSMVAAIANLKELTPEVYTRMDSSAASIQEGVQSELSHLGIKGHVARAVGLMHILHFGVDGMRNSRDGLNADREMELKFCLGVMSRGVYLAPTMASVTAAFTKDDVEKCVEVMTGVLRDLKRS